MENSFELLSVRQKIYYILKKKIIFLLHSRIEIYLNKIVKFYINLTGSSERRERMVLKIIYSVKFIKIKKNIGYFFSKRIAL